MLDIPKQVLDDLGLLASLDNNTASEFCKLVLNQLSKLHLLDRKEEAEFSKHDEKKSKKQLKFGISQKVLESAARKLAHLNGSASIAPDALSSTLQSIAYLYVESAKQKVTPDNLHGFLKEKVCYNKCI